MLPRARALPTPGRPAMARDDSAIRATCGATQTSWAILCSASPLVRDGAGDGNRTRVASLEGRAGPRVWPSTWDENPTALSLSDRAVPRLIAR